MQIETKNIRIIKYRDLDNSITTFLKSQGLNKNYECVAYEEWCNDSSYSFIVKPKINKDTCDEILNGELHYQTSNILNWMCASNQIEAGEYLVKVSW